MKLITLIVALVAILVTGCSTNTPNTFVAAERANFKAVSALLELDAAEHPERADMIHDKLTAWDASLKQAETATNPKP